MAGSLVVVYSEVGVYGPIGIRTALLLGEFAETGGDTVKMIALYSIWKTSDKSISVC